MTDAEADFKFPVLGFTTDLDIWGFDDLHALTVCGPDTLKDQMQDGMELIDAAGRRWVVRGVRRLERTGSILKRLLTGRSLFRIEHALDALPPVTLEDAKSRAVAALQAHPEFWCEDDERDTVLPERIVEVRATKSIAEIHELLGLDNFMAY